MADHRSATKKVGFAPGRSVGQRVDFARGCSVGQRVGSVLGFSAEQRVGSVLGRSAGRRVGLVLGFSAKQRVGLGPGRWAGQRVDRYWRPLKESFLAVVLLAPEVRMAGWPEKQPGVAQTVGSDSEQVSMEAGDQQVRRPDYCCRSRVLGPCHRSSPETMLGRRMG